MGYSWGTDGSRHFSMMMIAASVSPDLGIINFSLGDGNEHFKINFGIRTYFVQC